MSLGHESEIINFVPQYHNRYTFWQVNINSNHYKLVESNILLKFLWCLRFNLPSIIKEYLRKKAFDKFDSRYLQITKEKYRDLESLHLKAPQADIYIAGSDQIWNPHPNGIERAYFLDFGNQHVCRISYAASFGVNQISEPEGETIKKLVSNFNKISIRENAGKEILERLGIDKVDVVLDPAFLLSQNQWSNLSTSANAIKTPNRYILLYNFKNNDKIKNFSEKLKNEYNLPIVSLLCYDHIPYADIVIKKAGPKEFLRLIKDAAIVVSDSYHASIFSIIFNKDFYTFPLKGQDNSVRMMSLLDTFNIQERFDVESPSKINIDYDSVNRQITDLVSKSKKFIEESIQENF
ncbi:MAG: polysaccharide pyruvyl transferase family protein [Clostridium sp.]|nr:polysaccharide pyruvyl transferase family protein [Clostridium sp.]